MVKYILYSIFGQKITRHNIRSHNMKPIVFVDVEVSEQENKICDMGAVTDDGKEFHENDKAKFAKFISVYRYICGHNVVDFDINYIKEFIDENKTVQLVDTLPISPILYPEKPYHYLVKDDKLQVDEINNPCNDSKSAKKLLFDEAEKFLELNDNKKKIYARLLQADKHFCGFFDYLGYYFIGEIASLIEIEYKGKICSNVELLPIIKNNPVELAYCLAIISVSDPYSITPPWVLMNYPLVQNISKVLRGTICDEGCVYCNERLDVRRNLKRFFGYDDFRTYNGKPLQRDAAQSAVEGKSLLAVFPTGGGKSITFQLPALIASETVRGLTVVISPLQSLMKDQVDNLEHSGIADAVTINGLLSPIERAEAMERVESGVASILYISPESLRSRSIERILISRNVVRFVIDEAHCFSAWGQDFRVDYLYIGDFIKELQEKKHLSYTIPVSCFTATAKQKVISDIRDYFQHKLGLELELYATNSSRHNLHYAVLYKENDEQKYAELRNLIEMKKSPTIVYVSRTKKTLDISEKLCSDGFVARPFNGKMESSEKITNQEDFIEGKVQIIVATSAFGMGVDKKDVKLVVHFDISDSLENYVQEAGRAGRDQSLQADCYVLFNENDLDKHFILLNQTKLSMSEIQQVWKAIKDLTRIRSSVCCSPLEIARQAGWDDSVNDIETRVKTAVLALETAGYIKRGKNIPHIYATSLCVNTMEAATEKINASLRFSDSSRKNAMRIIKSLISSRSVANAGNDEAQSRIDYMSDKLGIPKSDVLSAIYYMREEGILKDDNDLTAYINNNQNENKSLLLLNRFIKVEDFLLSVLSDEEQVINLKEINQKAQDSGVKTCNVRMIKTVLFYWIIKGYIKKTYLSTDRHVNICPQTSVLEIKKKYDIRTDICRFIVTYLYNKSSESEADNKEQKLVMFSLLELKKSFSDDNNLLHKSGNISFEDIQDALLYLAKTDCIKLEGGFLVLYSGMEIKRIEMNNGIKYKKADYRQLDEFYQQKIQQIHIVGEYANMMVRDYDKALEFVNDYFQMEYKQFISKYFKGDRVIEITHNITPEKYKQLFGSLSKTQTDIISDDESQYIVVIAGPGSGKTRVLVHKLASLLLMEDVKHEQLLMLTFSRAAASEFKHRLVELIGSSANYIEIKTFHSYCFDLIGKVGNIEDVDNVVRTAGEMIRSGEVDIARITKSVVVIDEAQDMDEDEFVLVQALIERNDEMRVIAVGDDDQNIYQFRGSDSKYLKSLITHNNAKCYELCDNYRSSIQIVKFANMFAHTIEQRLKTEEIKAVKSDVGEVILIKHNSHNLEEAVVNDMQSSRKSGTVCILTSTNEEALKVTGILIRKGIKARLIQSDDSINLYNLAEMRHFIKIIGKNSQSPVISYDVWNKAKEEIKRIYSESQCLKSCIELIEEFESTNSQKYKTDLEVFLKESHFEDYYKVDSFQVVVSTIHKAKGKEFNNVYMLLDNIALKDDEAKRKIYVGITRAKDLLHLHYNNTSFDEFGLQGINIVKDTKQYLAPNEIAMQLSLRDVNLGFFRDKKNTVLKLHSGSELTIHNNVLFCNLPSGEKQVVMLSKKYQETLSLLKQRDYSPFKAKVRFIVAWKAEEDDTECAVILPDIYFRKN